MTSESPAEAEHRVAERAIQPRSWRPPNVNMRIACLVLVVACCAATATPAAAQTYAVRVLHDVPYLQGVNYPDNKDKLDLYLPEGRPNAPVIVSYYGNQLMGGDKSEDAFIGR
jgi:hypothetical protein